MTNADYSNSNNQNSVDNSIKHAVHELKDAVHDLNKGASSALHTAKQATEKKLEELGLNDGDPNNDND